MSPGRASGLGIDREGRFMHEGRPVTHPRFLAALFRWLDRDPDGTFVLRLDEARRATVEVEDTPLVVRSLRWDGARAWAALSDGSEELLEVASLVEGGDGLVRCLARGGRLPARLSNSALATLGERGEVVAKIRRQG